MGLRVGHSMVQAGVGVADAHVSAVSEVGSTSIEPGSDSKQSPGNSL